MNTLVPKPKILRDIDPNLDHVIEASAGTGKTYTIEHLVIDLLLRGIKLSEILLVTFTEKATRELKDRIRRKIYQMTHTSGGFSSLHPLVCWVIDKPKRRLLEEALLDFDNSAIYTIHGFCNQLLAEFAFENRQLFEMEQVRREELFDDLFFNYLRTHVLSRDEELKQLLLEYLAEKPNALATDGTEGLRGVVQKLIGKQGTLIPDVDAARQSWDAWRNFLREHDMAAIFSRFNCNSRSVASWTACLTELRQRVLDETAAKPLSAALIKDRRLSTLIKPDLKFNKKPAAGKINSATEAPETVQQFVELTHSARKHACDAEAALLVKLAPALRTAMEEAKRLRGQLDFDDMIRLVAEGVEASQDQAGGGNLIAAVRRKYKCALIDEFQDTDGLQWSIFSAIFLNSPDHRLFLIGDPKQAIYGFRGADVNTYIQARDILTRTPESGRLLHLDQNFRSSPQMIEAVNAIFTSPHIFQDHIRYDKPVSAGNPNNTADFDMGAAVTCLSLWPEEGEKKLKADDLREGFAHWIADHIQQILNHPDNHSISAKNMAVLVRSGTTDLPILSEIFSQKKIPHTFYKQGGLFQTPEAQDLFDLLYAIENNGDEAACFKALLGRFYNYRMGDLFGAPTLPEDVRDQLQEWRKTAYQDRDYRKLFNHIFQKTRIFERVLFAAGNERIVTNFEHLADILKREGANLDLKQLLQQFQSYIDGRKRAAGDEEMLRLETEDEAVRIMTIHASKGLEFEVVFLFGGFGRGNRQDFHEFHDKNHQGRILDLGRNHKDEHDQEQRAEDERIYYVALTRAKYKMFLPHVPLVDGKKPYALNGGYGILAPALQDLEKNNPPHIEFEYRHHIQRPRVSPPEPQETTEPTPLGQPMPIPGDNFPFREILNRRARFQLSSYTKLAHRGGADAGLMARFEIKALDEVLEDDLEDNQEDELPRGRETGICLHEILERAAELKLDHYPIDDPKPWAADPAVRAVIETHLVEYNLTDWYDQAAAVTHRALNTQVMDGVSIGWLPSRDRLHEVDFHFPIQKSNHNQVMLNGSIDLAFRHQGRFYFADWKSDALDDYRAEVLATKILKDYRIQIQIYLQAMLRWLKINDEADYEARFGGMFYFFLRGMGAGDGVYFYRPDWNEAQQLYESLKTLV